MARLPTGLPMRRLSFCQPDMHLMKFRFYPSNDDLKQPQLPTDQSTEIIIHKRQNRLGNGL